MIKQKHLASTLEHYFNKTITILFLICFFLVANYSHAENQDKNVNIEDINFPAAVIDMKAVLSKSLAFTTLQKEIQKLVYVPKTETFTEQNWYQQGQDTKINFEKATIPVSNDWTR